MENVVRPDPIIAVCVPVVHPLQHINLLSTMQEECLTLTPEGYTNIMYTHDTPCDRLSRCTLHGEVVSWLDVDPYQKPSHSSDSALVFFRKRRYAKARSTWPGTQSYSSAEVLLIRNQPDVHAPSSYLMLILHKLEFIIIFFIIIIIIII